MTAELDYVIKDRPMTLPVPLDTSEIAELARERAKQETKLAELEQKATDVKAEWKEKIDLQERVIAQLSDDIAREKQDRVILCDEIFQAGQIKTIRQDNGVVVASRPASPQEAQRHLPKMQVLNGGAPGILDQARANQKENASEENDDGDVVSPEGDAPKKRKKK